MTECYDEDCPLTDTKEPIGYCDNNEQIRLLCKDRKRLKEELNRCQEKIQECPVCGSRNVL